MTYLTASLKGTSFGAIHECFAQAFADYAVKAAVRDEPALRRRARKNDWAPELSAGVWAGNELVAISLTGVDIVEGEKRGYDICTGVIPDHRGKGVAGLLIDDMTPRLRDAGVAAFQLEVLQENNAGISAYRKAAFTVTRGLVSFAAPAGLVKPTDDPFQIEHIGLGELQALSSQMDYEPSFEQRDSAIAHLQDELVMLGAIANGRCVAAIAYDPETSWLMRIVTHRRWRRRGAASALLSELAGQVPAEAIIKAVNIVAQDQASLQLVRNAGLAKSISQWEMRLELGEL